MAGNIIKILANLPDFLRKSMLQTKLREFYLMEERDKHETISMVLKAASTIEASVLSVLMKTWMEVLSEFDGVRISNMVRIYCEEILMNPKAIENLNIESLINVFCSLQDKQKEKLADCLKEVILSFPNRYELLEIIPKPALKILKIK
ncbi:MAG: hypothetical protein WA421_19855 [Nitrososphaeraceae archaeon]|jgi:hypothetical protein